MTLRCPLDGISGDSWTISACYVSVISTRVSTGRSRFLCLRCVTAGAGSEKAMCYEARAREYQVKGEEPVCDCRSSTRAGRSSEIVPVYQRSRHGLFSLSFHMWARDTRYAMHGRMATLDCSPLQGQDSYARRYRRKMPCQFTISRAASQLRGSDLHFHSSFIPLQSCRVEYSAFRSLRRLIKMQQPDQMMLARMAAAHAMSASSPDSSGLVPPSREAVIKAESFQKVSHQTRPNHASSH